MGVVVSMSGYKLGGDARSPLGGQQLEGAVSSAGAHQKAKMTPGCPTAIERTPLSDSADQRVRLEASVMALSSVMDIVAAADDAAWTSPQASFNSPLAQTFKRLKGRVPETYTRELKLRIDIPDRHAVLATRRASLLGPRAIDSVLAELGTAPRFLR